MPFDVKQYPFIEGDDLAQRRIKLRERLGAVAEGTSLPAMS